MQTLPHATLTAPAPRGNGTNPSEIGQPQAKHTDQPPQGAASSKPEAPSFEDAFAKSAPVQNVATAEVPKPARTETDGSEADQDASEEHIANEGDRRLQTQNSPDGAAVLPDHATPYAAGKAEVETTDLEGRGHLGAQSAIVSVQGNAQLKNASHADLSHTAVGNQIAASLQPSDIPKATDQALAQGAATVAKTDLVPLSGLPQTTVILGGVADQTGDALGSKLNGAQPSSATAQSQLASLQAGPSATHEKGGNVAPAVQPKVIGTYDAPAPVGPSVDRGTGQVLPGSPVVSQVIASDSLQTGIPHAQTAGANAIRFADRHALSAEHQQDAIQPQKTTSGQAVSSPSIADQTRPEMGKLGAPTVIETPRTRRDAGTELPRIKVPAIHSAASTPSGAAQISPTLKSLLSETPSEPRSFSEPLFTSSRMEQVSAQTIQPNTVHRADLPPQTLRQIADILTQMPARPVEIALSPEELGRLRMTVRVSEGSIIVNMLAERPETLDLLRRHIDHLSEDFQSMGFENIAFSFAGEGGSAADDGPAENRTTLFADLDAEEPGPHIASHPSKGISASGLDLRL